MNRLCRRQLAKLGFGTVALAALAACATTTASGTTTVQVTLAGAQAEAQAIYNYLIAANTAAAASLSSGVEADVTTGLNALKAAVATFASVTSGATWQSYATAVLQGIAAVLAVLPIPGSILIYVTAGIGFITALLNSLASFTYTAPASTSLSAPVEVPIKVGASLMPVFPPIPIPVS